MSILRVNARFFVLLFVAAFGAGLILGCQAEEGGLASVVAPEGGVLPPLSPACKKDTECKSGHCDPLHGCVECVFDRHCPSGKACHAGQCENELACKTSAECAKSSTATPFCDVAAGHCARCTVDKDCGKNAHCVDQSCVPFIP